MQITWRGQTCFTIKSKNNGKETLLVINPFDPQKTGIKLKSLRPDIVLLSHNNFEYKNSKTEYFLINTPGEFEIKNIFIQGIPSPASKQNKKSNIIFIIESEGINIAHLGELGELLETEQLDKMKNIDILMVPVGGGRYLNSSQAIEIINQIDPRIIIPMQYHLPGLKEKLDKIEKFSQEIGISASKPVDKINISKNKLPHEGREIIIMNKK